MGTESLWMAALNVRNEKLRTVENLLSFSQFFMRYISETCLLSGYDYWSTTISYSSTCFSHTIESLLLSSTSLKAKFYFQQHNSSKYSTGLGSHRKLEQFCFFFMKECLAILHVTNWESCLCSAVHRNSLERHVRHWRTG